MGIGIDKLINSWDEREKISDPEAVKPDDWDEDAPRQVRLRVCAFVCT